MKNAGTLLLMCCLCALSFGNDEVLNVRASGKVVDQNGAAVVGAKITAERLGTSVRTDIVSDEEGAYKVDLAKGNYVFHVYANGFAVTEKRVELVNSTQEIDPIVLNVATATAVVTVSDAAPYVSTEMSSATKTFTPIRDVPQAISVIKREQIVDQNATSVADIVRYVPGVTVHQGENNRDQLIIRGQSTSADFFRDGVRDDVQYYRDPYNTESFEILRGPNAMIFGRGGGGGVVNRVTKEATFTPIRELTFTGGSYADRRLTGDFGQVLSKKMAFRVNGVYEATNSFRKNVDLNREGINPTFSFAPDSKTSINIGYEFFRDRRVADRGITSFQGRPANVPIDTYYGDPKQTFVRANVNLLNATVERVFGDVIFRSRTQFGHYDRMYQNMVPGAANAAGTLVTLTAYNNATKRSNLFNQTDLTYSFHTAKIKHTVVGGTEFGRQLTDNFRNTGFFNNTTTAIQVAFNNPVTTAPVTWRQSSTDANNHLKLNLGAGFAQDQIELMKWLQAIVGIRHDYFGLTFHNNRDGSTLTRVDKLVSPRAGFVLKPVTALSIYTSYGVSYLPSSGDQFSSLTTVTQQAKPEKFTNYEGGLKWDIRPGLFLSSAVYRLDRTNTRSTDPNDPTRIIQTGKQRTDGFEVGLTGNVARSWSMSGGYSWQNARITSSTASAVAGKQVGQVPHNMLSLWNKYQFTSRFGAGLGVVYRSDSFAAVDNAVVMPAYVIANAALYYSFSEHWRLQANVDNIANKRYYANADSNTNISPGAPRNIKIGLIARF